MARWPLLIPIASQLLAGIAAAQVLSITPGEPVSDEVIINDDPETTSFVTYSFTADDDVVAISIELEAVADLDLYVDTEYMNDYSDVLAASTGYAGNERLQIDMSHSPELLDSEFFIDVAYGRFDPPRSVDGEPLRRVPFTLSITMHRQRIDRTLDAGVIVSDRIDPGTSGPFRSYVIDVPRGTPALRVDLASDASDLDLRVRQGQPMRALRDADQMAVSWAGHETIVIAPRKGNIEPGRYYIDVFDQVWFDWPAEFRLLAAFSDDPPLDLIDLPVLEDVAGLPGAVNSTVEILHDDGGGTGVLLSESGYILTNYHVVEQAIEAGPWTTTRLLVGLTAEPTQGSRVRMLADVVAYDRDLDMALLKVQSDLYGNALPADYRFPSMALGRPEAMRLGDDLFVLGYPDAGSLGTRVSITLTRGIISGFEQRGTTLLIKSDADIASGNSGGPVFNDRYELIGIATEAISEERGNSQIGYIWPLWLVPDEWWQIAGVEDFPPTG